MLGRFGGAGETFVVHNYSTCFFTEVPFDKATISELQRRASTGVYMSVVVGL